MKWTYSIRNKMTAAVLLAVILGVTMLTNLVDRNRFQELERSFSSIYEDRLMAESYLFHLHENLRKNQSLMEAVAEEGMNPDAEASLNTYRAGRSVIIAKYAQTYLTKEEEARFSQLQAALSRIGRLEKEMIGQSRLPGSLYRQYHEVSEEAFATLSALSDIQTVVGTQLRDESKRIIMGSVSSSRFEMALLIIIAIVIQALVFSSRATWPIKNQHPGLN